MKIRSSLTIQVGVIAKALEGEDSEKWVADKAKIDKLPEMQALGAATILKQEDSFKGLLDDVKRCKSQLENYVGKCSTYKVAHDSKLKEEAESQIEMCKETYFCWRMLSILQKHADASDKSAKRLECVSAQTEMTECEFAPSKMPKPLLQAYRAGLRMQ